MDLEHDQLPDHTTTVALDKSSIVAAQRTGCRPMLIASTEIPATRRSGFRVVSERIAGVAAKV